jgi:TonB-dependent receptor
VRILSGDDRVKIGGEVRLRDKSTSEYDDNYATPDALPLTAFSGPAIGNYYDNHYPNGPVINRYAIRDLLTTLAQGQPPATFNPGSYQKDSEDIYAGYFQYTGKIGKFGILAGVRVEDTEANYGAYEFVTNADGSSSQNLVFRPVSYVDAFPTVQLRYDFSPHLVARLTYSTGLSRPGFNQNTSSTSIDLHSNPGTALISEGNPNLLPTTGDNFDFSLEYYLPNAGIIQFAAFDKEFSNYIVERLQLGVHNSPLAPAGDLADITTYENIPNAYARGLTVAYHQKFTWLPDPLNGFGVEGNFTYVDSKILESDGVTNGTGVNQYNLLPGTAAISWNLAAFYEAHGFDIQLSSQYNSHSLFGLGGGLINDIYEDSRFLLDLTSSYKINKTWTVYFNTRNLTNQPLRYYQGAFDRPVQREFYDVTYEFGVRAHF